MKTLTDKKPDDEHTDIQEHRREQSAKKDAEQKATVNGTTPHKDLPTDTTHAPNTTSDADVDKKIEQMTQSMSRVLEIEPGSDGKKVVKITQRKFHNGIFRQLKQLSGAAFTPFNFDADNNPYEQFITQVNIVKMQIDNLTNEELDFLYEMAKQLEHSHKDAKEAYEFYYKPVVILYCLREMDTKFGLLEQLVKDMLRTAIFQVTFSCIDNIDNAVVRGQKLHEIQGGNEDVSEAVFHDNFQQVFNPELSQMLDFYRWMIYGDESENMQDNELEEINEFLDKSQE